MLRHSSRNASSFDLKRPVVFIQYFRQKKIDTFYNKCQRTFIYLQ